MRQEKPGAVKRIFEGESSPGIEFHKDRTVLDATRVFVSLNGEEVSLAELLRELPTRAFLRDIPRPHRVS